MSIINGIVAKSLLITVAVLVIMTISSKSSAESDSTRGYGEHWPDFSCIPHHYNTNRHNSFFYNRMAWHSCRESHEKYKQTCDKMCALMGIDVIMKTKKGEPFRFYTEAFITNMLEELGFGDYGKPVSEAPQELVRNVTAALDICKTKYREFETMTNVRYLPCEPYMGLFACVHNATSCSGDYYKD